MTGLIVCLAVLAAASVYGVIHRRREGRIRVRAKDGQERLTAADLGGPLGERATLVQFSSACVRPVRPSRPASPGFPRQGIAAFMRPQ